MTSSVAFGSEVQKFYNTEEENQNNNNTVYQNYSADCTSSDRPWDFRSKEFQFEIAVRKHALSVEICDFQQSVSVPANAAVKPRPLHTTPFPMYYALAFSQKKLQKNRIYQVKIRNRGSEKIWKYNIKRILGKQNIGK